MNEVAPMHSIFTGVVGRGFQLASGQAVGRKKNPSPYPAATLKMQNPLFKRQNIDLEQLIPDLHWGTINVELGSKLLLRDGDYIAREVDWTKGVKGEGRIKPETFSFVHCCLIYRPPMEAVFGYYPGLLYYPHPQTKPETNRHNFDVLEVLTVQVPKLVYGARVAVTCRADAFELL